LETKSKGLLLEYASEMTAAILEEAYQLSKHRKADKIEVADVSLVLGKKFGIVVPGITPQSKKPNHVTGPTRESASTSSRGKVESQAAALSVKGSDRAAQVFQHPAATGVTPRKRGRE